LPTGALDLTHFLAGETTPAPGCIFKAPNDDCVHPRNLTNDETGLKNRTDAEIKRMFLDGKRPAPTGEEALHPVMPYYVLHNMTDADADAIVAYLRTVPGVKNEIPRRGPTFDLQQPVPPLSLAKVPQPSPSYPEQAAAQRGKYLATQTGLCIECHSEHLRMGPTALNEDKLFQGGEDFTGVLGPNFPFPIRSKNLTPDGTTGIGTWTLDEVVRSMKMGVDKAGKGICPPMPAGMAGYGRLADEDANAIAHYLLSIPPAVNMVPDMCTFPPGP
jgi:mono/diheme cytochrome c family protein